MAKKNGFHPYVMLSGGLTPGGGEVIGGGTGEGTTDIWPMSFEEWKTSGMQEDYDNDGDYDIYDYVDWWSGGTAEQGFTEDAWNSLNPNYPWNEYMMP